MQATYKINCVVLAGIKPMLMYAPFCVENESSETVLVADTAVAMKVIVICASCATGPASMAPPPGKIIDTDSLAAPVKRSAPPIMTELPPGTTLHSVPATLNVPLSTSCAGDVALLTSRR